MISQASFGHLCAGDSLTLNEMSSIAFPWQAHNTYAFFAFGSVCASLLTVRVLSSCVVVFADRRARASMVGFA